MDTPSPFSPCFAEHDEETEAAQAFSTAYAALVQELNQSTTPALRGLARAMRRTEQVKVHTGLITIQISPVVTGQYVQYSVYEDLIVRGLLQGIDNVVDQRTVDDTALDAIWYHLAGFHGKFSAHPTT